MRDLEVETGYGMEVDKCKLLLEGGKYGSDSNKNSYCDVYMIVMESRKAIRIKTTSK